MKKLITLLSLCLTLFTVTCYADSPQYCEFPSDIANITPGYKVFCPISTKSYPLSHGSAISSANCKKIKGTISTHRHLPHGNLFVYTKYLS